MKKKFLTGLAGVLLAATLISCGEADTPETETSASDTGSVTPSETPSTTPSDTVTDRTEETESAELTGYKKAALDKLDSIVNPVIDKITDEDLRKKVRDFYDSEKSYINDITDVATAKEAASKVVEDSKSFATNTLKPYAIKLLGNYINPVLEEITDEELKNSIQNFYNTEMEKMNAELTFDTISDVYAEILNDTKEYVKKTCAEYLEKYKNKALDELSTYVHALIEKLPYESLSADLQDFYDTEIEKMKALDDIADINPTKETIKADLESFALRESIKLALAELDKAETEIAGKITNEDLKKDLTTFYADEKAKLEAVSTLEDIKTTLETLKTDITNFVFNEAKSIATDTLNTFLNTLIEKIPYDTLKGDTKELYETEMAKLEAVTSYDDLDGVVDEIKKDLENYALTESIKLGLAELDPYVTALIEKIPYDKVKTDTKTQYETEKAKLNAVTSVDNIKATVEEIKTDMEDFAVTEAITLAIEELDPYATELIGKVNDEDLKESISDFYATEKKKMEGVTKIEDITPTLNEIKADLKNYGITQFKSYALGKLDDVVTAGLKRMSNDDLKTELNDFYDDEKVKINAITDLDSAESTLKTVLEDTATEIQKLAVSVMKAYLAELFTYDEANPYDYIPEAMRPSYASNFVTSPITDFTTDTAVSDMNQQGFGEQWQMVVSNINQMLSTVNALNVVSDAMTTVSKAMNIYVDQFNGDTVSNTIDNETYTAVLSFNNGIFYLGVTFKASYTVAAIGSVKPVVKMAVDTTTGKKATYIALTDADMIKYTTGEDTFELALTYGVTVSGKSGSRTSYFSSEKDENDKVTGHIYEYTTYEDSDIESACADFYIDGDYVSVIGNKASGMTGWTGYINELYKASEGRLLGYKVQETKTIAGVSATYHTLWFNLWDISGIDSIKATEIEPTPSAGNPTLNVYLNGSSTLFTQTYNTQTVLTKEFKTSRMYDIELRSRYYYSMVDDTLTATEVEVPMMFIQDDHDSYTNYTDFSSNMLADNGITASVIINSEVLAKIRSDYDTYIPVFQENKDSVSSETIKTYLTTFNN